ncbi:MAG: methyltransferase [Methanomicrobiaceae archaeon]|nr:methyltransferase [Methanomicrobiaceae archaeon]
MKLRHLEMALERCAGFTRPRAPLEQYGTPAVVAARLLYHAHLKGDIGGKRVLDLGCGTGVLACGASLLGAAEVMGLDVDSGAIGTARENAALLGADVTFITGDVSDDTLFPVFCPCDTVVMNPPFGAQKRHADRPFIDRSLACAQVVYGIFNAGTRPFLDAYIRGRASVDEAIACSFPLKRSFSHHTRDRMEIPVEIVRIIQK